MDKLDEEYTPGFSENPTTNKVITTLLDLSLIFSAGVLVLGTVRMFVQAWREAKARRRAEVTKAYRSGAFKTILHIFRYDPQEVTTDGGDGKH